MRKLSRRISLLDSRLCPWRRMFLITAGATLRRNYSHDRQITRNCRRIIRKCVSRCSFARNPLANFAARRIITTAAIQSRDMQSGNLTVLATRVSSELLLRSPRRGFPLASLVSPRSSICNFITRDGNPQVSLSLWKNSSPLSLPPSSHNFSIKLGCYFNIADVKENNMIAIVEHLSSDCVPTHRGGLKRAFKARETGCYRVTEPLFRYMMPLKNDSVILCSVKRRSILQTGSSGFILMMQMAQKGSTFDVTCFNSIALT